MDEIDCEVKRGRGRPRKEEPCKNIHAVRFDDDDESKLTHIMIEDGGNPSEIIRKALRLYYTVQSNKWR